MKEISFKNFPLNANPPTLYQLIHFLSSETVNKNKPPNRPHQYRSTSTIQDSIAPIPNEAKLSLPTTKESDNPDLLKNLDENCKNAPDMGQKEIVVTSNDTNPEISTQKLDQINDQKEVDLDHEKPPNEVESVIERQKRIEEENKRKKAAIAKALEDRYHTIRI